MRPSRLTLNALLIAACSAPLSSTAQDQQGTIAAQTAYGVTGQSFSIIGNVNPLCTGPFNYVVVNENTPWGTNYGPMATYFNLPADNGPQTFSIQFAYQDWDWFVAPDYQLFIDGEYCPSCSVQVTSHQYGGGSTSDPGSITWLDNITVQHQADAAWLNDGVHEFGLRMSLYGFTEADIRFKAVMVGSAFSDLQGYFDAPQLPLYILRDPPGDLSYSQLSTSESTCVGNSVSVTTDQSESTWLKAKVGVEYSISFFFLSVNVESFYEAGENSTVGRTETGDREYLTCIETTSEYTTAQTGPPDDQFIGSAIRYAYGMATTIDRPSCGTIQKYAGFAMEPVGLLSTYSYSESYIRGRVLDSLQAVIAGGVPSTLEHKKAVSQLDVWYRTLAMNDAIKNSSPFLINRNFNGNGNTQNYSITQTTQTSNSIDYSVYLENGLTEEFGVYVGGSGVGGGGELRMRKEYGRGQSSSNEHTNTMAYELGDEESSDNFSVDVRGDRVFGTYAFSLDSSQSATSCPYEGGYQIQQPQLSVGSMDQTHMDLEEQTIGGFATYPIIVCNNSSFAATYYLKFESQTNGNSAILNAYGTQLTGADNQSGIQLNLDPFECDTAQLLLNQLNPAILDYENINVYLYSDCEPLLRSTITISAYFGAGNVNEGNYCVPTSQFGPTAGDWIDGVQLGSIYNSGTGGMAGSAYTNYTAQYSTDLSRTSPAMITITSGDQPVGQYAAWIDYDQNGQFAPSEKLGEFATTNAFESQNISFTVPGSATLGTTRLRVRCQNATGVLDPCISYPYGETEDYAVVIDGDTPLDCLGQQGGTAWPGLPCDDENADTGNDLFNANCICAGQWLDCDTVPGGTAFAGSPCDDNNASTVDDVYGLNCVCAGLTYDCAGIPGGNATNGTPCDDGNAATGADVYDANCDCAGVLIDCTGTIGGGTLPGTACDDGNPLSGGDVYIAGCLCVGQLAVDCEGVENGPAQPGTACDDNEPATGLDVLDAGCVCAGQPFDCAGTAGGTQLPGTDCDDGNPATTFDVYTAGCACLGVAASDCLGAPGGPAQPGTPCDDNDPATGNDVFTSFCACVGEFIDCDGVAGGSALAGFPCDDQDATTGFDVWDGACQCAGQPIDCEGLPGGTNTIGSPCDDGNAETTSDSYNANCICAGTLANDCEGVAGGTAQPGSACDDGDPDTGNDLYSANCECAGALIDCAGTAGGTSLPGTTCDDGIACTTADAWATDCTCSGTAVTIGNVSGSTLVIGLTSNAYFVNPVAGATSYEWTLPNGWTTADNSAFVIVAEANNTPGEVELCVTATVGACEVTSCITVTVDFNTGIITPAANTSEWFTVQPNPYNGVFQLIPASDDAPMTITVYDGTGRTVKAQFPVAGKRTVALDLGEVAPGAYYLMATREGQTRAVKIMVER